MRRRGSSGRYTYAFWPASPLVHRTNRPTAWRKNSSVTTVLAYTPTRRRGMSTPSLTIRTATSQWRSLAAKWAILALASGSSLTTTSASTWKRWRISRAMSRACSWSMQIARPPASGWVSRIFCRRSWAWPMTALSQSPCRLSAARSRWDAPVRSSSSWKLAVRTVPSGALHSISPSKRGK